MLLSALFLSLFSCASTPKPLYELGLGAGFFDIPLYLGARERQRRALVLPFGVYRGKYIKADDRSGVRSEFIETSSYRFDLSFSGAFSGAAAGSGIRKGMPDLDWLLEIGPRLVFYLTSSQDPWDVQAVFPTRPVFSTDFRKVQGRGWTFNPYLSFSRNEFEFPWLDIFFRIGVNTATRSYHAFFYEISEDYQLPNRPRYQSREGLSSLSLDAATAIRISPAWRMFYGASMQDFSMATNQDSALLNAHQTYSLAVGIIWRAIRSKKRQTPSRRN